MRFGGEGNIAEIHVVVTARFGGEGTLSLKYTLKLQRGLGVRERYR